MDTKTKITNIIKELNHAVAAGDLSKLDSIFHDDVKIVSPDMKILGDGKEVCIKSYADFVSKAKVEQYDDNVSEVFVFKNTAITFYTYNMTWSMEGKSITDQGKELYVLTMKNDDWFIVLRKLIASDL